MKNFNTAKFRKGVKFFLLFVAFVCLINIYQLNPKKESEKKETLAEKVVAAEKPAKVAESRKEFSSEELALFEGAYNPKDFVGNAQRFRVLAKTRKHKYDPAVVEKLEKYLFPWIKPFVQNLDELKYKFKGRGIVMCVGDKFLKDVQITIAIIRKYFQSNVPIEIMHLGDELSIESQKKLLLIPELKIIDLSRVFPKVHLQDWNMKPFAMLASSFDETIIMDADVIFVQHPEKLFQAPKYKETGAVFFHDRAAGNKNGATEWVKSLFDEKGYQSVKHLRFMKTETGHEQESGVVLIRKSDRYLGLLVTCWMNLKLERDIANTYVHGDKETFWIGFTIVHEPFTFVDADTTALVGEPKGNRICSAQLGHLDWHKKLFWFDSGLMVDKENQSSSPATLTHYGIPGNWEHKGFHTFCLDSQEKLIPLSEVNTQAIEVGKEAGRKTNN